MIGHCSFIWADTNSSANPSTLKAGDDLVPSQPGKAPSYWCTWEAQYYIFGDGAKTLDPKELEGITGAQHARSALNEDRVFGPNGWASTFFPKIRGDLYILYDDGLFRGPGEGLFHIDTEKFPSLARLEPKEQLRKLNEMTRAQGWRGAAVWCRVPATSGETANNYVLWSKYAGIEYWKIDGGDENFAFIDLAKKLDSTLKCEHVKPVDPFNGHWQSGDVGRAGDYQPDWQGARCLEHSDVYRTYDTSAALSFPTALDRVASCLRYGNDHKLHALINCEDEVYLAATMGCTMGIMRNPLIGLRPPPDIDINFTCPRQCKRRMDEVVRAVRWQRIAQPFVDYGGPLPENATAIDSKILVDAWKFKSGETWKTEAIGNTVRQGAPARVSRGLPLPEVTSEGEPPFVMATRFPNGAIAVGVQGRTSADHNWTFSPTDVTVSVGNSCGPVGIFGLYRNLTLSFNSSLGSARILAQDLAGDHSEDITSEVKIKDKTLNLSGELIKKIGLSAANPGDLSDPGMVIVIQKQ